MYIRTKDEAMDTVAEILELPERRTQIVQATVKIMLCLSAEPRAFLADCQALLIEGGLEHLRKKRREQMETTDTVPIIVLDPEEDRLFESVGSALDALRLSEVARQIFPTLASAHERWEVARALLVDEAAFQENVTAAIKSRSNPGEFAKAHAAIEGMIVALKPAWAGRAVAIRAACLDVLTGAGQTPQEKLLQEAETLFELFATSDERALKLLNAVAADPQEAVFQIGRLHEILGAVRAVQEETK